MLKQDRKTEMIAASLFLFMPLMMFAFGTTDPSILFNVSHESGMTDDFSNIFVNLVTNNSVSPADYSVQQIEPGSWALLNISVPENENYEINVSVQPAAEESEPVLLIPDSNGSEFSESEHTVSEPAASDLNSSESVSENSSFVDVDDYLNISVENISESNVTEEPTNVSENCTYYEGNCFVPVDTLINETTNDDGANETIPAIIPVVVVNETSTANSTTELTNETNTDFVDVETYLNNTQENESILTAENQTDAVVPSENSTVIESILDTPADDTALDDKAYNFNDNYIALDWANPYPEGNSFSAEIWIQTTDLADAAIVGSPGDGAVESYWAIAKEWQDDRAVFSLRVNGGSGETVGRGTTNIADGNWHHLVFVRDRSTRLINGYVDGALEIQFTDTTSHIDDKATTLLVGNVNPHQDEWFVGEASGLATYQRALSSEEVAQLFRQKPVALEAQQ